MAKGDKEILQQFVDIVVPEIKAVSKGFADDVEATVREDEFTIFTSPYAQTLIDGRAPTKSGAKRGNPSLQELILDWIKRNSIMARADSKGRMPTQEQLSWSMATVIHRDGTKLYRMGGGNDIYKGIISEERLSNLLSLIGRRYQEQLISSNTLIPKS